MKALIITLKQILNKIADAIFGRKASAASDPVPRYYVVQAGDTLWSIARRFNTTVQDLVEANDIEDPGLINVGQRLVIPTGQEPPPPEPPDPPSEEYFEYAVQRGDTLWGISRRFDTTVQKLAEINHIEDASLISVGQILLIPKGVEPPPTPEPPPPTPEPPPTPSEEYFEYAVQRGDTLWGISRRFDTTVQKLAEINHLEDASLISVGQVLLIPKGVEPPPPTPEPPTPEPPPPAPARVKGLYVTYWAARHAGLRSHALQLLEETELNAIVIDIKGDDGLLYDTFTAPTISRAEEEEALAVTEFKDYQSTDLSWTRAMTASSSYDQVRDFGAMMAWLQERGYYTIARVIVFKDDQLVGQRPDLAVKDSRTGQPWRDYKGVGWSDPCQPEVWEYNAAIAREAARRGFDEIQYDYVRFPTDGPTEYAQYAQENTAENRQAAINDLLTLTRQYLRPTGAKLAVDFFGYTCWRTDDPNIGQVIESVAPHIDVLCPMLYPSTFGAGLPGFPQYSNAIAFPYEVVYLSTVRAVERLKKVNPAASVRCWIQDFPDYRFDKRTYTPEEIREEMRGAMEGGAEGWMLWDPRVKYTREALKPAEEAPAIPTYPPNKMGRILVLLYHKIGEPEDRWTRTPDNFGRDLEYLLAHGYYPVNLIDVVRRNLAHVPRGRRPVVLAFDDSSEGQFYYLEDGSIDPHCAAGIMHAMHKRYGPDWPLRATFFVLLNADEPGTPLFRQGDTGPQKVRTLVEWGMEIGSHTINHPNLSEATPEQIKWELAVSQNRIEALIPGHEVRCFAVPFGAYPDDLSLLKEGYCQSEDLHYRYEAAVKVGAQPTPSPFAPGFDPFRIPRVQAFQDELDRWLPYFEQYPERYYVSDGGQGEG